MEPGIDLNAKAVQSRFADLVGCSKQAISKRVERGDLSREGTYAEWISAYVESLRTEAAGRSGDAQKSLTEQRIAESAEKTLSLKLANFKELRALAPTEEFVAASNEFSREIIGALSELKLSMKLKIRSRFEKLEFEDHVIDEPIESAAKRIARNAEKLGQNFLQNGGEFDA